MKFRILAVCAVLLSLLPSTSAQKAESNVKIVDPGFESFQLTKGPIYGWYSDDVVFQNDPRFASITMTPDSEFKTEGHYSLRIEQLQPRPINLGQAFLCQAMHIAKSGGARDFDLGIQMRGAMRGPVLIDVYVWDPGYIARAISRKEVHVGKEWSDTTVSFKVPSGHDEYGIWIYMPREPEAVLWVDNLRLVAKK